MGQKELVFLFVATADEVCSVKKTVGSSAWPL